MNAVHWHIQMVASSVTQLLDVQVSTLLEKRRIMILVDDGS
jgi:hypothetical protein